MSSPPWYMHLQYGISLPLQMCIRNRIDKNSPVNSPEYILPLFVTNRQRGQGEKRVRDEGTNNDAWRVRYE